METRKENLKKIFALLFFCTLLMLNGIVSYAEGKDLWDNFSDKENESNKESFKPNTFPNPSEIDSNNVFDRIRDLLKESGYYLEEDEINFIPVVNSSDSYVFISLENLGLNKNEYVNGDTIYIMENPVNSDECKIKESKVELINGQLGIKVSANEEKNIVVVKSEENKTTGGSITNIPVDTKDPVNSDNIQNSSSSTNTSTNQCSPECQAQIDELKTQVKDLQSQIEQLQSQMNALQNGIVYNSENKRDNSSSNEISNIDTNNKDANTIDTSVTTTTTDVPVANSSNEMNIKSVQTGDNFKMVGFIFISVFSLCGVVLCIKNIKKNF